MKRRLFCIWFGEPMSPQRNACFDSMRANCGIELILITETNLEEYVPPHAIHPAFGHLSPVHKSDYMRTYLMYHHGGGYSDIKRCHHDWNPWFDTLEQSDKWCMGYSEADPGDTPVPELAQHYRDLIGNGQYIFKPQTELAAEWYSRMLQKMNEKRALLGQYPAAAPRRQPPGSLYPLAWAELLGCQFHPVVYKYRDKVLHGMPAIDTNNYL